MYAEARPLTGNRIRVACVKFNKGELTLEQFATALCGEHPVVSYSRWQRIIKGQIVPVTSIDFGCPIQASVLIGGGY